MSNSREERSYALLKIAIAEAAIILILSGIIGVLVADRIIAAYPPAQTTAPLTYYEFLEQGGEMQPLSRLTPPAERPLTAEPELELTYLGAYKITGYDPLCAHCCGKSDGVTASGAQATPGYTAAAHRDIPFGSVLYVEGLGTYEVQDRGVGAGVIDIACGSHAECYAITGNYTVWLARAAKEDSEGGKHVLVPEL